jgi:hypothetical protein
MRRSGIVMLVASLLFMVFAVGCAAENNGRSPSSRPETRRLR